MKKAFPMLRMHRRTDGGDIVVAEVHVSDWRIVKVCYAIDICRARRETAFVYRRACLLCVLEISHDHSSRTSNWGQARQFRCDRTSQRLPRASQPWGIYENCASTCFDSFRYGCSREASTVRQYRKRDETLDGEAIEADAKGRIADGRSKWISGSPTHFSREITMAIVYLNTDSRYGRGGEELGTRSTSAPYPEECFIYYNSGESPLFLLLECAGIMRAAFRARGSLPVNVSSSEVTLPVVYAGWQLYHRTGCTCYWYTLVHMCCRRKSRRQNGQVSFIREETFFYAQPNKIFYP